MYHDGKVMAVEETIKYHLFQTNILSSYINPSINILERNSRGRIFTTNYLPFIQNDNVFILHENGEIEQVGTE